MTRLCSMHHCQSDAVHTIEFPESPYDHSRESFCATCLDAIGRAWRDATTVVVEVGYRRRYPNGTAGLLHDDASAAGTLDEVTELELDGSKLVKVTTRKAKP